MVEIKDPYPTAGRFFLVELIFGLFCIYFKGCHHPEITLGISLNGIPGPSYLFRVLDLLYWSKPSWCDILLCPQDPLIPITLLTLYFLVLQAYLYLPTLVWFISTALKSLWLGTELQTLYRTVLVLVLVRGLERNRAIRICMDFHEKICDGGLIHAITEAEKSHNLPFVSWISRKASGIVLVQTQRPKSQESWCLMADDDECVDSRRANTFVLPLTFCSGQDLNWLDDSSCIGEGRFSLSLQIQMLTSSGNTLTDTPRNNVLSAT